jgi:hypothetical protein
MSASFDPGLHRSARNSPGVALCSHTQWGVAHRDAGAACGLRRRVVGALGGSGLPCGGGFVGHRATARSAHDGSAARTRRRPSPRRRPARIRRGTGYGDRSGGTGCRPHRRTALNEPYRGRAGLERTVRRRAARQYDEGSADEITATVGASRPSHKLRTRHGDERSAI